MIGSTDYPRFQVVRVRIDGTLGIVCSLRKTYSEAQKAKANLILSDNRDYRIIEVEVKGEVLEHNGQRVGVMPI